MDYLLDYWELLDQMLMSFLGLFLALPLFWFPFYRAVETNCIDQQSMQKRRTELEWNGNYLWRF